MKDHDLLEVVGGINEKYIKNADSTIEKKSRKTYFKWIAVAACLCFVVTSVIIIPKFSNQTDSPEVNPSTENKGVYASMENQNTVTDNHHAGTVQDHILDTPQEMIIKIVSWGGDGFKVTVVNAEENTIFTENAELTVEFNENTVFTLSNGSTITFNPDDADSTSISMAVGWPEGSIVIVEFIAYEDYIEGNHFYNRATASHLELVE